MNALQSLALAAQLLGLDAVLPPKAVEPTPLFSVALADAQAAQDGACRDARTARVCAAYGPGYELWVKARVDGSWYSFPKSELKTGVDAGGARLSFEGGAILVDGERVPEMELVAALYASSRRVTLGVVDYAVLYEDGALVPHSATFLRRDHEGNYFMAWRPAQRLATYEWLLAVNGIMYGPRLEGEAMRFYSKPVPNVPEPLGEGSFYGERPVR